MGRRHGATAKKIPFATLETAGELVEALAHVSKLVDGMRLMAEHRGAVLRFLIDQAQKIAENEHYGCALESGVPVTKPERD